MATSSKDTSVTAEELADWLGLTTRTVQQHATTGVVRRAARGKFFLRASVKSYCAHQRKSATGRGSETSEDRLRLLKAQADAAEHKLAVQRGKYLLASETETTWSNAFRRVQAGMLTAPSRIAARLPHLTPDDINEIYLVIRDILTEIAEEIGGKE